MPGPVRARCLGHIVALTPALCSRGRAYRNTIKALNWYSSVREKIDDPAYASWFIKFRGFKDSPYPGGTGKETNGSFHVPTCDWFGTAAKPAKCSGFCARHSRPSGFGQRAHVMR